MSRKLLLNSFSGTILYMINVIVAFIMSPVLIRALGNRDYGLWELVMSVIGYIGLLDLGIGPALIRFVSVADGKQDRSDLQQTISTAFAFFILAGGFALALFSMLSFFPQLVTGNDTKNIANLRTVFLLFGLDASIMFPLQVFTATLMGLQRHYFINCVRGVLTIVRVVLVFYLLQRYPGNGLIVLALLEPVFCLIQFVLFALVVFFDKNLPPITFRAVTWRKLHELFTFGAKSATMLVASRLQNQSVPLIIGSVIGLGQIVYFVMPNRLVDYAKGFSQTLGLPLIPYFGASIGKGNREELLKSWFSTTQALQVVSLAMPVVIYFYGASFLSIWIGQEYANAGSGVMYFLLLGLVADSLAINASRILVAQGIHGKNAIIWLLLSALSIPVGIGGASLWGVTGVVIGTTMVTVIGNLVTVLLSCSAMRISLKIYFKETLMHLVFPLVLLAITMQTFTLLYPVKGYANLLAQILTAGFIYIMAIWCFTLDRSIKIKLLERMRSIIPQDV